MAFTSTQIWTAISAGTMVDLDERRFYGARIDLYGQGQIVYWTEDGLIDGTSLFGTSHMPLVEVCVADHTSRQAWTRDGNWGAMVVNEYAGTQGVYSWLTTYDGSNAVWVTEVYNGSPYGDAGAAGSLQQRPAWVYALGGAQSG